MKLYVMNESSAVLFYVTFKLFWYLFVVFLFFVQPDTVTGDIVFVLQQKEHPKFKRKGEDLFVEHTLSLTEALCGFQFVLTHLDGRQLLIKTNPGEVVKPGKQSIEFVLIYPLQLLIWRY